MDGALESVWDLVKPLVGTLRATWDENVTSFEVVQSITDVSLPRRCRARVTGPALWRGLGRLLAGGAPCGRRVPAALKPRRGPGAGRRQRDSGLREPGSGWRRAARGRAEAGPGPDQPAAGLEDGFSAGVRVSGG